MISDLEIIDRAYTLVNVPDVKSALGGGDIYKSIRPINSKKIDIVIGCLPTNNLQLQTAVINVNIHVPNLELKLNDVQDKTQPDYAKLRTLTSLVMSKLNDIQFSDHWFDVESQNTFAEPEIHEHYSNIRVKFHSINI